MVDRRNLLHGMGALGAAGAIAAAGLSQHAKAAAGAALTGSALKGPYLDLTTGAGNKVAWARLHSDIDPSKQKHSWFRGYVMAARPDEPLQDLFGFEGLSTARIQIQKDGSYLKLLREVGLYTDLKTGEVLEKWHNPFLDEDVKVVPIANDPFNFVITEFGQGDPMNAGRGGDRKPFHLPWRQRGDWLDLEDHVHLRYPNSLEPEKWVRESSGPEVIASEMTVYHVRAAAMQDKDITGLSWFGTWGRRTPWLPWMLMGTAPGFCLYSAMVGSGEDLEQVHSRKTLDYVEKHYPKFLQAPADWDGKPNRSSLENYAVQQQPAAAKNK